MRSVLLLCVAVLPLAACGDDRVVYGESSPPWFYAPTPPAAYVPRPGMVAAPGGAPYAVSGEASDAYIGPGEARPAPANACAPGDPPNVCTPGN